MFGLAALSRSDHAAGLYTARYCGGPKLEQLQKPYDPTAEAVRYHCRVTIKASPQNPLFELPAQPVATTHWPGSTAKPATSVPTKPSRYTSPKRAPASSIDQPTNVFMPDSLRPSSPMPRSSHPPQSPPLVPYSTVHTHHTEGETS
jgi:hypothetical protein